MKRVLTVGGLAVALTAGAVAPAGAATVHGTLTYTTPLAAHHSVPGVGRLSTTPIKKLQINYTYKKHAGLLKVQAFAAGTNKPLGKPVVLKAKGKLYTLYSGAGVHGFKLKWSASKAVTVKGWVFWS